MRALVFFVALFFVGLLCANNIPSYVLRGHAERRSGNVVITPTRHRRSSGLLFLDHARHTRDGIVDDINVANLITHIFQTAPPTNERQPLAIDRSSFPVLSLFSAPPANLFVVIEAVTAEDLQAFPSLSLLKTRKKIEIRSTSQSHDTLADIETFLTGVSPSQHGIVGRSWLSPEGTETSAFSDRGSSSRADSFIDILALTSPESLILSMSSNEQAASSIGVRVPHIFTSPNVLSYYWNSNHQNFGTVPKIRMNHPIKSSRADILGSLLSRTNNDIFSYKDITIEMDERNMQVFVSSFHNARVAFDLNTEEDFRVFVELYFVAKAARLLQGGLISHQVEDNHPDSFAFSFDAIRDIRSKYGARSPQFSTTLLLIDSALGSFVDVIQSLYRHKTSSQIIFVPPVDRPLPSDVTEQIDEVVSTSGSIKAFLPEIYMGHELSSSGEELLLISHLNAFLNNLGFTAYWFGRQNSLPDQQLVLSGKASRNANFKARSTEHAHALARYIASSSARAPAVQKKRSSQGTEFNWNVYKWFGFRFNWTGITYTQKQVEAYQIQFWTSFFLIIITFGACCSMCLLNPEKNNEVLYRQTALGRETDTIPGGEYDFKPM